MSNTALRAEKKKDSRTITFKNKEHEKFYKVLSALETAGNKEFDEGTEKKGKKKYR